MLLCSAFFPPHKKKLQEWENELKTLISLMEKIVYYKENQIRT